MFVWHHQRPENRMERLMPLVSHFYCRATWGFSKRTWRIHAVTSTARDPNHHLFSRMIQNSFFRLFFSHRQGHRNIKAKRLLNNLLFSQPETSISEFQMNSISPLRKPTMGECLVNHVKNSPRVSIFLTLSRRGTMRKEQPFRLMQIGSSHRSAKEPSILVNLNKLATQNEDEEKEKPLIV